MIPRRTPTNLSVVYYKCTLHFEATLCVTLRKRIFSSMMYRYRVEYRDCLSTLTICARSVHSVEVRWRYSSPKSFSCSCLLTSLLLLKQICFTILLFIGRAYYMLSCIIVRFVNTISWSKFVCVTSERCEFSNKWMSITERNLYGIGKLLYVPLLSCLVYYAQLFSVSELLWLFMCVFVFQFHVLLIVISTFKKYLIFTVIYPISPHRTHI